MEYNFKDIEKKWQEYWKKNKTYLTVEDKNKEKSYILDMFPYPSGAGLHVGHPLGYIASDIYARYQKLKGKNVLHPMGFDAFGLPAEQYAIETGQHPAVTTELNIKRYKKQLNLIGFSYDWNREIRTSDPNYYKWTQWIFLQFFKHWYNKDTDKAEKIDKLIKIFETKGNIEVNAYTTCKIRFSAKEWNSFSTNKKEEILLEYRLAYLADTEVNWCPALGTVLSNEEVKDGFSERGGYPVIKKKMKQWCLRITAYADRLLDGLNKIDWPHSIKEIQRNWIGKSKGAEIFFQVEGTNKKIKVFTTRPDTIFGATFMVLAPEHPLLDEIIKKDKKNEILEYKKRVKNKTLLDRISETKDISGVFTGTYALNPFTEKKIPIYVSDYVIADYGTGAIMAVPSGDQRDWNFAKKFNLPIIPVIEGTDISKGANENKNGILINSAFLNGLKVKDAIELIIKKIEEKGIGKRSIKYKLRDAVFSRQRYWGEPFPIFYKNNIPYPIAEDKLPLKLPKIDKYLPTKDGKAPLARAKNWKSKEEFPIETNTMPGWAGSSWYFIRYMDNNNNLEFASKEKIEYWKEVDVYVGGAEHATGHLIYARFFTKFLYDIGYLPFDEPFKKLINQGMILGVSAFVYRIKGTNKFVSYNLKNNYNIIPIHVDISLLKNNNELDIEKFKKWRNDFKNAEFILEDGKYICGRKVEKMSKSKWNVVNPDDIIDKYGADTLRLYEMFLGPIEDSKPWDTKGIEGVYRFLRKFWSLFHQNGQFNISNEKANKKELKILHKTIKKVNEDIEKFSFNTAISAFMICVNELIKCKCNKKEILEPLIILLSPFAPHICEELWNKMGYNYSVTKAQYPKFNKEYIKEEEIKYPVSFNGKVRFNLELPVDMKTEEIKKEVLTHKLSQKWLAGKEPKKVIVVPKKIVNVVI